MDLQLTTKAQEAFSAAVQLPRRPGTRTPSRPIFMAALLDQQGTTTSALVEAAGATTTQLVQTTRRSLDALPSVTGSSVASPTPSRSTLAVLENAAPRWPRCRTPSSPPTTSCSPWPAPAGSASTPPRWRPAYRGFVVARR